MPIDTRYTEVIKTSRKNCTACAEEIAVDPKFTMDCTGCEHDTYDASEPVSEETNWRGNTSPEVIK